MTYIGLGTSVCLSLNIPIVLHSLAQCFAPLKKEDLPVKFDLDFMALLEAGTRPADPYAVVESYMQAWWKGTALERRMGPMNKSAIEDAVIHHRKELSKIEGLDDDVSRSPKSNASSFFTPANPQNNSEVLFDAIHRAGILASGLSDSAQGERQLILRRVSAFHMLHQACVVADVEDTRSERSLKKQGQNTKWITGKTLTIADVLDMYTPSDSSFHDGYINELPDNTLPGVYSTEETLSSKGSILTHESTSTYDLPPESDLGFPDRFSARHYRLSDWGARDDSSRHNSRPVQTAQRNVVIAEARNCLFS